MMTTEKKTIKRVLKHALKGAEYNLQQYVEENNFDDDDSPEYNEMAGYNKATAELREQIAVFEHLLKTR